MMHASLLCRYCLSRLIIAPRCFSGQGTGYAVSYTAIARSWVGHVPATFSSGLAGQHPARL